MGNSRFSLFLLLHNLKFLDKSEYFVQVKYNGQIPLLPICSDIMCPYSQFQELVNSRIPTDFNKECQLQ